MTVRLTRDQAALLARITGEAVTKRCTQCRETLPIDEFRSDHRDRGDGYQTWCRDCEAQYREQYDAGFRRRSRRAAQRRRQAKAIFVCLCTTARPAPKACAGCGYPVVARMDPELQARMAEKYPPIVDQRIEPTHQGAPT